MSAVAEHDMALGELSKTLGREKHQITYAIRARGIQPARRAGNTRLFDQKAVEQIRQALAEVDARRAPLVQIGAVSS